MKKSFMKKLIVPVLALGMIFGTSVSTKAILDVEYGAYDLTLPTGQGGVSVPDYCTKHYSTDAVINDTVGSSTVSRYVWARYNSSGNSWDRIGPDTYYNPANVRRQLITINNPSWYNGWKVDLRMYTASNQTFNINVYGTWTADDKLAG